VIQRCRLAPADRTAPLLAEANELTAILTAGMKRLRPVALRTLAVIVLVLVLSSEFSVLSFLVFPPVPIFQTDNVM